MNVEEFVREALAQTFRGVKAAAHDAAGAGGEIAPVEWGNRVRATGSGDRPIIDIQFDIAVTVEQQGGAKGNLTVFGIGMEAGGLKATSSVSRIQFSVPVVLPSSVGAPPKGPEAEGVGRNRPDLDDF